MQRNNFHLKRVILSVLIATNLLFGVLSRNGEIVSDSVTELQWQDDDIVASTERTWIEAIDYCENTLTLGGHDDWRLPNIKELLSIVDRSRHNPAIDTSSNGFQNYSSNFYWSSTTYVFPGWTDYAWVLDLGNGYSSSYGSKSYNNYVRCVRGGE